MRQEIGNSEKYIKSEIFTHLSNNLIIKTVTLIKRDKMETNSSVINQQGLGLKVWVIGYETGVFVARKVGSLVGLGKNYNNIIYGILSQLIEGIK